eukprot:3571916-Rhodomonas_salina.1
MCTECRERVPQCLYCVHADRIEAEDLRLAQANGRRHGSRLPPIRSSARASLARRREVIADELWREFMSRHPDFSGSLSEFHLSSFRNE